MMIRYVALHVGYAESWRPAAFCFEVQGRAGFNSGEEALGSLTRWLLHKYKEECWGEFDMEGFVNFITDLQSSNCNDWGGWDDYEDSENPELVWSPWVGIGDIVKAGPGEVKVIDEHGGYELARIAEGILGKD